MYAISRCLTGILYRSIRFARIQSYSGSFAHDHQKVVGHGVAVGRAAGQIPEQQDIFGIEIAVSQALDDPGGFGGIVKAFGGLSRFGGYALCGVFLHGVLIRFHSIDC